MKTKFDVIVIGGGGSGLAAALSAAEQGLEVLVLEKNPACGGTTGIAVGSFTACCTQMQRAKGVSDDLQSHVEDAGRFAPPEIEERNNTGLRRLLLSESANTLDWLIRMGVTFQGPNPEPPNRLPRMHNVVPRAMVYISVLESQFRRRGGTILCQAVAKEIAVEKGRVSGVFAQLPEGGQRFSASRGVVLAAGDYAASSDLIAEYKGSNFSTIDGINQHATGDGHRLARAVGANLVNMDVTYGPEIRFVPPETKGWIERLPSSGWMAKGLGLASKLLPARLEARIAKRLLVTWQHPEDSLFADGSILLNKLGQRFCDETRWPDREIAISYQPDKECYFLLDSQLVERYSRWPHFVSTAPEIAYAYVQDYERLRPDITFRGESLDEVASRAGLPTSAVKETVQQHNATSRRPLIAGPWVILGPAKAYFTTTEGGASIDESLRVLNADGRVIDGLYAVGQNGLGGQILWGHGLHIAWAITSGRLVGRSLSAGKRTSPAEPVA